LETSFTKAWHHQVHWCLVDADGKVLGRLAARAARVLMGKDSPQWTPHADHRNGLIVINAGKIRLTGRKADQKLYRHFTGYPGGLREVSARHQLETKPERVVRDAILGMLPKTRLGARLATRLKVYAGSDFPHQAQKPEPVNLERAV
jgi:large subunit ribosomal protein L13